VNGTPTNSYALTNVCPTPLISPVPVVPRAISMTGMRKLSPMPSSSAAKILRPMIPTANVGRYAAT
jgi:hypothetical protein